MSPLEFVRTYKKTVLGAGVLVLLLLLINHAHSLHLKRIQAEEAYFNGQESFVLPAVAGGSTTFKDVEKHFQDYCGQKYESVSVVSVGLSCDAKEITHYENNSMDPRAASTISELKVIEDFNREHSGTFLDGIDADWKISVTITHRRNRTLGNDKPLSVEWLCPNPLTTGEWPEQSGLSGVALAGSKYGINFTRASTRTFFSDGYKGVGQGVMETKTQGKKAFRVTVTGDARSQPEASPSVKVECDDTDLQAKLNAWASNSWNNAIASFRPIDFTVVVTELEYHPERINLDYTGRRAWISAKVVKFITPNALDTLSVGEVIELSGEIIGKYLTTYRIDADKKFVISGTLYHTPQRQKYYVRSAGLAPDV